MHFLLDTLDYCDLDRKRNFIKIVITPHHFPWLLLINPCTLLAGVRIQILDIANELVSNELATPGLVIFLDKPYSPTCNSIYLLGKTV